MKNIGSCRNIAICFMVEAELLKDKGKWITEYSRNIGICSVVEAELWAIMG